MSSQLQNIQVSLKDLSKNIDNGLYSIPKFQRNFVWKKVDIESLGDSLIRGYPISSMLEMSMSGSLSVGYESLKTGGYEVSKEAKNEGIYILDGQQRITSIAKIFNNFDENNTYYFDLLAILMDKFPEDNVENLIKKENVGKLMKSKVTESLCRSLSNGKSDFQPTRYTRFISGRTVIDDKFGSAINKFLRNFDDTDEEKIDKYNDFLSALFGALTNYSIQITEINPDADLGLICRIFEKVNSTGVKLTTFDLINAKSFNSEKISNSGGLANYITKDIMNFYDNSDLCNSKCFISDFLSYSQEMESFKELSKIIRALFLNNCLEENKNPYLTQSTLLSKPSEFWVDSWNKKKGIFIDFINILEKENLTGLLPTSFLEYVISIAFTYPEALKNPGFIKMIKKNGLSLAIMGSTITKSEIEIYKKMAEYTKDLVLKNVDSHSDCLFINFDLPNIEDINQNKKSFRAIFYIMTHEHFLGKFTKDLTNNNINLSSNNVDCHHFIPKSKVKNKGNIFNSIVNFVPLNSYVNREEIKDQYPSIYMSNLEKDILNFDHIKQQNLIPENISDDEEFLNERKKMLEEYILNYFS